MSRRRAATIVATVATAVVVGIVLWGTREVIDRAHEVTTESGVKTLRLCALATAFVATVPLLLVLAGWFRHTVIAIVNALALAFICRAAIQGVDTGPDADTSGLAVMGVLVAVSLALGASIVILGFLATKDDPQAATTS